MPNQTLPMMDQDSMSVPSGTSAFTGAPFIRWDDGLPEADYIALFDGQPGLCTNFAFEDPFAYDFMPADFCASAVSHASAQSLLRSSPCSRRGGRHPEDAVRWP